MKIEARLETLDQRYQQLENEIEQEMRRPAHDELKIHRLKREKLALKDEMQDLRKTAKVG